MREEEVYREMVCQWQRTAKSQMLIIRDQLFRFISDRYIRELIKAMKSRAVAQVNGECSE